MILNRCVLTAFFWQSRAESQVKKKGRVRVSVSGWARVPSEPKTDPGEHQGLVPPGPGGPAAGHGGAGDQIEGLAKRT